MLVYVKHIASKDDWAKPKDGSDDWLNYWYRHSRYKYPTICPDCGRTIISKNDLVGAHVMKVNSTDKTVYIVPVCRSCNTKGGSDHHSFLCDEDLLVPANKNNL